MPASKDGGQGFECICISWDEGELAAAVRAHGARAVIVGVGPYKGPLFDALGHTCGTMATAKTCPHDEADRVALSGTRVREMLAQGQAPPEEFTRPEVARILLRAAENRQGD